MNSGKLWERPHQENSFVEALHRPWQSVWIARQAVQYTETEVDRSDRLGPARPISTDQIECPTVGRKQLI